MTDTPGAADTARILVYDNSPQYSTPPQIDERVTYRVAEENTGLATAYNLALDEATRAGDPWLLLLDQDTVLTPEYFQELLHHARELEPVREVAAIAPKLAWNDTIYSPESNFFDQLRDQFPHRSHAVSQSASGIQQRRLAAYNSGALIKTEALRAIGGFPEEFWLDYLDHAVFHLLATRGLRTYIMQATLQHPLAHIDPNSVPLWRERNVLTAQTLLVKRFGSLREKWLYRIFLVRMSKRSFRECRDYHVWMEKLLQSLLLRVPVLRIGGARQ